MNDFDFLKQYGFGVVYGEKAVREKIEELACKIDGIDTSKTMMNKSDSEVTSSIPEASLNA